MHKFDPGSYSTKLFDRNGRKVDEYQQPSFLAAQEVGELSMDLGDAASYVVTLCIHNSKQPRKRKWEV